MSKTYWEKLKDPRWQQKRLEIMERDEFTCRHCSSKDKTLNVHHSYYRKGADPWDYESRLLITLCEDCHGSLTDELKEVSEFMSSHPWKKDIILRIVRTYENAGTAEDGGALTAFLLSFLDCFFYASVGGDLSEGRAAGHQHCQAMFGRLLRDAGAAMTELQDKISKEEE